MLASLAGLAALAAVGTQEASPYIQSWGGPTVEVSEGLWDMKTHEQTGLDALVKAAKGVRFVLVGESHDKASHHEFQAKVIEALARSGRYVTVGMEMFTRDNQRNVYPFSAGIWDDATFQKESDWKNQWGFDYGLYKPIFDLVRSERLPLYALNTPKAWVKEIGQKGPEALTKDKKPWLPELYLGNAKHRSLFDSMMGGHQPTGASNIYAAMVSWDEGMAKSAVDAMEDKLSDKWVMVICAGSGHVMFGQGIAYRIQRLTGEKSLISVCLDEVPGGKVSQGIGDFLFVSGGGD